MFKYFLSPLGQSRFWLFTLCLALVLLAVPFLPQNTRDQLRLAWLSERSIFVSKVDASIGHSTGKAATKPTSDASFSLGEQAASVLDQQLSNETSLEWHNIWVNPKWSVIIRVSIPPSLLSGFLNWIVCIVFPRAAPTAVVQNETRELQRMRTGDTVSDSLIQAANNASEASIRARQLRIAFRYAMASGAITVLVHPKGFGLLPSVTPQLHFWLVSLASAILGAWGSLAFTTSRSTVLALAGKLGFGSLFLGGMIALALTMPYQLMNPGTASLFRREEVGAILINRLILFPSAGWFGAAATVIVDRISRHEAVKLLHP